MPNTERITFLTQQKYAVDHVLGAVRSPLTDKAGQIARDLVFGGVNHWGAQIIGSEARREGRNFVQRNLYDPRHVAEVASGKFDGLVMISVTDPSVDQLREILKKTPTNCHERIIVGGIAVGPSYNSLCHEFPDVTFVLGEAEGIVSRILDDRSRGKMEKLYYRSGPVDLSECGHEAYMDSRFDPRSQTEYTRSPLKLVELSRNCAEKCEFCHSGKHPETYKSTADLLAELRNIHVLPGEAMFVIDQNLFASPPENLIEFFTEVNRRGIPWIGEGTITRMLPDGRRIIDHEELMTTLAKGALSFLVGLEDPRHPVRGSATKNGLRDNFNDTLRRARELKFPITWSMIIGLDNQTPADILHYAKWITENSLDVYTHLLQPRAGTATFQKLEKSGRFTETDSRKRDGYHLVVEPAGMTLEAFPNVSKADICIAGYIWLKKKIFSSLEIARRFEKNFLIGGPRYATGLTIVGTAQKLSGIRLAGMYPHLKPIVAEFERMYQKHQY